MLAPSPLPRSRPRLRLVAGLLLLVALTLTVVDARQGQSSPLDVVRRGADTALAPLQRAASAAVRPLHGGGGDAAALRRDNDALRRQVLALQGAQAQAAEVSSLLRLKDAGSYTTVLARVVGLGASSPFESVLTLDVGTRDGVRVGQAVIDGAGLVGRTVRVSSSTTTVALVTDPSVTVGVRVATGPRSFGLVTGHGRDGVQLALVTPPDVPVGAPALHVGDALVTAGSDTYAPGIPVGRITHVGPVGQGIVPTATVQPYAGLGSPDLLQVVVEGPRSEPRVPLPPS